MKKNPNLAELHAFGLRLSQRAPIKDMRSVFLSHRSPVKFNYDLNALTNEPIVKRARFEWQGKWDENNEYPIYEFIGLE